MSNEQTQPTEAIVAQGALGRVRVASRYEGGVGPAAAPGTYYGLRLRGWGAARVRGQSEAMNEEKAREILGEWIGNRADPNALEYLGGPYVCWAPNRGDEITLDGPFSLEELEALAWWVRKYGEKENS